MEPGHEDREDDLDWGNVDIEGRPQWSPAMKTGKTSNMLASGHGDEAAAMEPGHEDREDPARDWQVGSVRAWPQWSPAMKTGKTCGNGRRSTHQACRNGARP